MANCAMALSLVLLLCWPKNLWAATDTKSEAVKLPKLQEIVDAQFRCDWKAIQKYSWDKRYRDIVKLANKVWEVVKDVKVEPRSPVLHPEKDEIKEGYTYSLTAMATLRCGKDSEIINQGKGEFFKTLTVIRTSNKKRLFDLVDDDSPPIEFGDRTMVSDGPTDAPDWPERTGFMCFVKYDDFIRDANAIDLKKLCHNESKIKIAKTKKEIERVKDILKKANKQPGQRLAFKTEV